jgi:2-polyprenyl-6-methoxyphenol hydroxylase-like FAD-dependent oxidoreductase
VSRNTPEQAVIVVGAGPAGLTLACELAAAGVSCTVLERRAQPSAEPRPMALHSRTLEVLDLRGLADELLAAGTRVGRVALGGGAAVDFAALDSRFPHLTVVPQARVEEVLRERAADLGVTVEHGTEVWGLRQSGTDVTLQVRTDTEEWEESADYVVGCDGASSAVRQLTGIPFHGGTYGIAPVLADVRLRKPPPQEALVLFERGGFVFSLPCGDGRWRFLVAHRDLRWTDAPVTLGEVTRHLGRALGFDPRPYDAAWLTRFKIHQRLADQYRAGRVLLAGDAAHLHSPLGGQGLNLGVQDAVNLGWKLAAEIQGWAPPGLLDTYESERRPHAAQVLRATDRATSLATTSSPLLGGARRAALRLATPAARRRTAELAAGLRLAYPPAGAPASAHAGRRLPDRIISRHEAPPARLYELMRDGRFLLLDSTAEGTAAALAEGWASRVCTVRTPAPLPGFPEAAVLLARPDGYLAWTAPATSPADHLRATLLHWCGPEERRPARKRAPADAAAAPATKAPRSEDQSCAQAESGPPASARAEAEDRTR